MFTIEHFLTCFAHGVIPKGWEYSDYGGARERFTFRCAVTHTQALCRAKKTFLSSETLVNGFGRNARSDIRPPCKAMRSPVYPDMNSERRPGRITFACSYRSNPLCPNMMRSVSSKSISCPDDVMISRAFSALLASMIR